MISFRIGIVCFFLAAITFFPARAENAKDIATKGIAGAVKGAEGNALTGDAEEYITNDGAVRVTIPNARTFSRMESPPSPMEAVWLSHDRRLRLAISVTQLPKNAAGRLSHKIMEQETAESVQGTLLESKQRQMGNVTVHTFAAHGTAMDAEATIKQSIFAIDNVAYVVMAMGIGVDPREDPAAREFLETFEILRQPTQPGRLKPVQKMGGTMTTEERIGRFSQGLVCFSIFLLIVCGAVYLLFGKKPKRPISRKPADDADMSHLSNLNFPDDKK